MANIIFLLCMLVSIIYAIFSGHIESLSKGLLNLPKESILVFFDMSCLVVFWSGILEVSLQSGLLFKITKVIKKIISPLFSMDKSEVALDYISMNLVCNLMGVGGAATPFGLKAMKELDRLNSHSEVASADMITFLLMNTSGICFIPSTIISLRETYHSVNSTKVIPYIIILSFTTLFVSIFLDRLERKKHEY